MLLLGRASGSILPASWAHAAPDRLRKGAAVELSFSDLFVHPVVLYSGLALGAIGVWFAMPRASRGPRELGAVVAAAGVGIVLLALLLTFGVDRAPNLFFYAFSLIGLGSALRVITHPRPVYSALFFILTILSSAGLYILLSAEFLAFALVIIYAGAILITYLFVIMLATQAPSEDAPEEIEESDRVARNPIGAVFAGFLLLAALTGMFNSGVKSLPAPGAVEANTVLRELPLKVSRALASVGFPDSVQAGHDPDRGLAVTSSGDETFATVTVPWDDGIELFKSYVVAIHTELAEDAAANGRSYDVRREASRTQLPVPGTERTTPLFAANETLTPMAPELFARFKTFEISAGGPVIRVFTPNVKRPTKLADDAPWEPNWSMVVNVPASADAVNLERVGFALLAEHPLALELAGVILLMALVGAVVIARKNIEHGEAATELAAERRTA